MKNIIKAVIIASIFYFLSTGFLSSKGQEEALHVSHVVDGDTVKLSTGQYIRLVGINAPDRGERLYNESTAKLSELVLGKELSTESDSVNRDQYQRLLRYLFVNDVNANIELVRGGYARSYLLQKDMKYAREIMEAEKYAKANRLGIWSLD